MPEALSWVKGPEWGVAITVIAYVLALQLRNRFKWLPPVLSASVVIMAVLVLCGLSYDDYRVGGNLIIYMLGPATIALGVPLYKYGIRMKRQLRAIVIGVAAGSCFSIVSTWLIGKMLGLSPQIVDSLLPKSVTTAVSVQLSSQIGGIPEMTAVVTVLTGLLGSVFGPLVLRWIRVRGDVSIGTSIGTTAHGIGTARLFGDSEWQASVSALSMSLSCIITPIIMLLIH